MTRRRERGEGNVGCIISLIILAIAIILALKIVPQRIAVAELQDFCEKTAEQSSGRMTDERIAYEVLTKAQNEHLPVSKEQIKVWRNQSEINIEVRYTVKLDLLVTTYDWKVETLVSRPLF